MKQAREELLFGLALTKLLPVPSIGLSNCSPLPAAFLREAKRLALKIIKLGMGTREVVARFEAERQALGMMDHPNIAKVLDAGARDNGRPFVVMNT